MATGTVKWFNNKKGYGFITPDEGGQDIFVHISAVQKAGLRSLEEGAKISYELLSERGKTVAGNLKLLSYCKFSKNPPSLGGGFFLQKSYNFDKNKF